VCRNRFVAGGVEGTREGVIRTEPKEHRTHIRLHPRIDDGEDLCPPAPRPCTPHGGHSPPAGPQRAAHGLERGDRVGDIHQPERTQGRVEEVACHRRAGVLTTEPGVRQAARSGFLLRRLHHGLRKVGAQHEAVWSNQPGRFTRDETGPAGHVEDALARCQGGHVEQTLLRGPDLRGPARFVVVGGTVPSVPLDAQLQLCVHDSSTPSREVTIWRNTDTGTGRRNTSR
jgi:hypothetical protein